MKTQKKAAVQAKRTMTILRKGQMRRTVMDALVEYGLLESASMGG